MRALFSSEKMHDAMVFAVALIVAAGFWVLQKLNDTFEMDIDVPVSLVGVPHGVTLTTPLPKSVHVTMRDRGTQLIHYIRHSISPISLEFSLYDNGSATGHGYVPIADVQHALNMQMLTSTIIQRITPDTLEFYYNRGLHRRIPVRLMGTIETVKQSYLHDVSFSPDSVVVYAPSSVLDTMTYAYTEELHLNDIETNLTEDIKLRSMRGVKYEPASVRMSAQVDYYTERTFTIPIVGVNFPADKILRAFPSSVNVTFRIGSLDYNSVTADDFVLTVSYEELINNPGERFHLELKSIPETASLPRLSPSEFEYLIEHIGDEDTPSHPKEEDTPDE